MSRNPAPKPAMAAFIEDADTKDLKVASRSDADPTDVVVDDVPIVSTLVDPAREPVVTRRELWAYYLYYNGDNVCARPVTMENVLTVSQGVGPNGYSMTLFQSLATSAGFDPVRGKGSSCTDAGASGQCVVPWAGGTKSVTSAVLVASGASFAVSICVITSAQKTHTEVGRSKP
jgi:hypothetical protein